jgi:intraflagellar transport protein 172
VCFGLADGKIKLGMLSTNKTYTLYTHPDGAAVTALAAAPDGRGVVSGHADGSLYHFTFPEAQVGGGRLLGAAPGFSGQKESSCLIIRHEPWRQAMQLERIPPPACMAHAQDGRGPAGCTKLAHHSCTPCALAWGESIAATGPDCRVAFYDPTTGREQAAFEHGADDEARGFACAAVNPAGDAVVIGAVDRLYVFSRGGAKGAWQAAGFKQVRAPWAAPRWRWLLALAAAVWGCCWYVSHWPARP